MRRRLLILGIVVSGLVVCRLLSPEPPTRAAHQEKPRADKGGLKPFYAPAVSCARNCHDLPKPLEEKDYPPVCRCIEYDVWAGSRGWPGDKHSDASKLLRSQRGLDVAKRLGIDKPEKDARCLNCHSFSTRDEDLLDRPEVIVTEGVTCVVCHGAYKNWVSEHHGNNVAKDRAAWRKLSRKKKEDDYGMRDLWDPVKRVRLCVSCHVGDAGKGVAEAKLVTHEMYAAGHPPLPGFEPAAFSEAMRHWQYLREKAPEVQKLLQYDSAELEQAHLVAVGGAVVFESSVRLLAEEARSCAAKSQALDLACFDCAACHHELRSPSWRQQRGYAGKPGRPLAPVWPAALLRASVAHAEGYDEKRIAESFKEYEKRLAALRGALSEQPLGRPEKVAAEAAALGEWSSSLAERVGSAPMRREDARRFLRVLLGERPRAEVLDYDSARQVAWAAEMVFKDLNPDLAKQDQVPPPFVALDRELSLALPRGLRPTIVEQLKGALKVRSEYDPEKFRALLGKIPLSSREE